jgi:hypothetical protein
LTNPFVTPDYGMLISRVSLCDSESSSIIIIKYHVEVTAKFDYLFQVHSIVKFIHFNTLLILKRNLGELTTFRQPK